MAPTAWRSLRRRARPLKAAARRVKHRLRPPADSLEPAVRAVLDRNAALTEAKDFEESERLLEKALAERPDQVVFHAARARLEARRGDWEAARVRWAVLIETRGDEIGALGWVSAIHTNRRAGHVEEAERLIRIASERWPFRRILHWEAAHVAMTRGDWEQATLRWVRYWRALVRDQPHDLRPLPRRAGNADWYEAAWHEVATHLDAADAQLERPIGPGFHLALAQVLAKAGMTEDQERVLERGTRVHPDDAALAYALAVLRLHRGSTRSPLPITDQEIADVRGALPPYTPTGDGLGPVRLIRVPQHSSLELALRAGHYVDRSAIGPLVQQISERDRWPEPLGETNLLLAGARAWARRFGERYAAPPHLPAETLADAVMVNVYHESAQFVPMQRLADELTARAGAEPVVIEIPAASVDYLEGYASGEFDLIYLYFALLERGTNAFLCVREKGSVGRSPETFSFKPRWRSVIPHVKVLDDPAPHQRALVPAGIRRVAPLVQELDDLVVYQSGSVVKEFAYDRSIEQDFPVTATARLHPEHSPLPTFSFPLSRVARLTGRDLGTGGDAKVKGAIELGEPLGGSWPEWLHRATWPLLDHLSRTAAADLERRGVTEVHIGDHLFAESVIVGDAVRRTGGRVVIWPHSTNPVHVDLRRADSFDEVHAVTHSGAEVWRAAFPDKTVLHTPDSMLSPLPPRAFDPEQPVSLVLFGGRSTLGNMPILDTEAHRALYRRLFADLAALRETHPVEVYFKARGLTGEHEHWLFQTVGKAADWKPVYAHPLRLDLPNMVFASVSVGTSALIEGLSRGIPGFVVREFPVRDYTTLDEETFPIVPSAEAMKVLARTTTAEGYAELIEQELHHMKDELGLS